jgi:hypothetical protein
MSNHESRWISAYDALAAMTRAYLKRRLKPHQDTWGANKRNYRHLRPDYLAELIGAVEDYWREMTRFTTVHIRSQLGPKITSMAAARVGRRLEKR